MRCIILSNQPALLILLQTGSIEYSVFLRPEATSVTIPPEFLDPGTEYELEILAIEESDNQTFRALSFETAQ